MIVWLQNHLCKVARQRAGQAERDRLRDAVMLDGRDRLRDATRALSGIVGEIVGDLSLPSQGVALVIDLHTERARRGGWLAMPEVHPHARGEHGAHPAGV